MNILGVLTVGKAHKKLLSGVQAITESLALLENDLNERLAKSETQTFAMLDGRLSRDLRAVLSGQTEMLSRLDHLEKAQQMILDRLSESDTLEGLRRRIRYLERALQDHLANHDDDPLENFNPGEKFDPLERYEASKRTTEQPQQPRLDRAGPPKSDRVNRFEPQNRTRPGS